MVRRTRRARRACTRRRRHRRTAHKHKFVSVSAPRLRRTRRKLRRRIRGGEDPDNIVHINNPMHSENVPLYDEPDIVHINNPMHSENVPLYDKPDIVHTNNSMHSEKVPLYPGTQDVEINPDPTENSFYLNYKSHTPIQNLKHIKRQFTQKANIYKHDIKNYTQNARNYLWKKINGNSSQPPFSSVIT